MDKIFSKETAAAAAAKSLQSCLTLCDSVDCSPPGSYVHGILQARILEWVAISFSLSMYVDCNLQVIMQFSDLNLQAVPGHGSNIY